MKDLYDSYANDPDHMPDYIAYQARYRQAPRESDKVLIGMLAGVTGDVLDIGCSTGNLLFHIRREHPHLRLVGGDLSKIQIQACMQDRSLEGIRFEEMDIRSLRHAAYSAVIANATIAVLRESELDECFAGFRRILRPGGRLLIFDYMHPFAQEIHIVEKSAAFPDGIALHFKSYGLVRRLLGKCGFIRERFAPFVMPFELPFNGYESVQTYTKNGESFRGAIYQPWCHLEAIKD